MKLTTLEEQLRDKNEDIFRMYQKIKEGMSTILKNYELKKNLNPWESIVDYYTLHGYQHCKNFLTKLNYLLTKADLNSYELFYILSAVWLHDIGMIEHPYGGNTLKARKHHHNTSVEYFKNYFAPTYLENAGLPGIFRLTIKDKVAICEIIKYHRRKENIKEVEEYFDRDGIENRVFLRYLATIFRIADGLELDNTRAPFFIYERNKESMPYLNKIFWEQHFPITSIVPNMDKGGLIEIKFSRSESPNGMIHGKDMVSILLQVSRDINSEIDSVAGETSPSYPNFNESNKITLSGTVFINEEKKANDPERIFRPKDEEKPSGWEIRENIGWGHPGLIDNELKTGELTNYSEIQSCFVNTSKTEEFLKLVSEEYKNPYYLLSPANTGKSTLLNVASWQIFKDSKGIRSYVILIEKRVPTFAELMEHLKNYFYIENESFICIFDRMEQIPSNIPDPKPLINLIQTLKANGHTVWGAGRTWDEFQFTETWKEFIEKEFEIHKFPELLNESNAQKFKSKFEKLFTDESELSKFWSIIQEEKEIETDSLCQLYTVLKSKGSKMPDTELRKIVKEKVKRTSTRYDKIYRSLTPWEYNVFCLAYKFHGIFKEVANNAISAFEHKEMNFVDEMIEAGKIETGLYRFSEKDENVVGIVGIHLNDESRKIMENQRTAGAIESTCTSLLRNFFETDSEKACQAILFFFNARRLLNPVLLKEFIELVKRCRNEFLNFHILSYLARDTPSLAKYWKELINQKDKAPDEWLFGETVINFGLAIARQYENVVENEAFGKIINLIPNEKLQHNFGVELGNFRMFEHALIAYDKAIELDPKLAYPWNGKGNALRNLGQQEEAIKAYDKAIELDPKLEAPWYGKGNALRNLGQQEEAIKAYDKAIELDPKLEAPWNGKGNAFSELGQQEEAIKAYDKAIELDPKYAYPWNGKGNAFSELGQQEEAIKAYDKAIELDPKDAAPWYGKGNALRNLGQQEEAIKAYDKAIELDPKDAAPWYGKGNALRNLGQQEEAIKAYDKAIELDPKLEAPWNGKGNAFSELRQQEEAIKAYDKAIELDPKDAAPWYGKGNALRNLGQQEEAIKAYDKAIELDPKLEAPWNGKGNAFSELGQQEEAIKAYDKAIELDPKYAYPWNGKGNAFSELRQQEEAIKAYDKAIELDPKDAAPWNGKGILFWRTKSMEKSKQTFENAIERFPKDSSLISNYSELLITMGKFEDAMKSIEKTLELCSSLEDKQNMRVMQITLSMIIEGFDKAKEVVRLFIDDFKFQNSQWDYSDIVPALSDLSEIDRKRIEAIQNLNLGRHSVNSVKELWNL